MRLDSSVNTLITSKANTDLPSFSLNIQPGWQNSKINFIKLFISFPVGKIAKKNSLKDCVFSKIHFYRLLFRRFCPLAYIKIQYNVNIFIGKSRYSALYSKSVDMYVSLLDSVFLVTSSKKLLKMDCKPYR